MTAFAQHLLYSEIRRIREQDERLTPEETARILRVSSATLKLWRSTGRQPLRFLRMEGGTVRYRRSDVLAFKASRAPK